MKKNTLERILKVTVILTVIGILIFKLLGINILTKEGIIKIPSLISGIVSFWVFYISIGWKLPLLKHIVYQENINGTWFGTYSSRDFTTNEKYDGEIAMIVRQSFLRINIKSMTMNYINYSFGEAFIYDSKSDSNQLIYLYSQSEFNPTDDNIRKGTSELMLHFNISGQEFFGDFWTNHNSKGNLNLKKVSKKHAKSFLEAKKRRK
ncbi:hypothetical protein D3C87_335690 [compost metagenome]